MPFTFATVGAGYIPVRSPVAAPLGGKATGICPNVAESAEALPFARPVSFWLFIEIEADGAAI
jgi:hypothetical protein